MEIHQIRYMCAVAETGSFTAAASREHVAQPSLSQQIIKLEDELGAKLFHRFRRKTRLTEFGKAFLPRAQEILRAVSMAKSEIHELTNSTRGMVKIGVIPTIAPYLLPKVLPSFSKKFPEVEVNITEDITHILLQKLQETALDMAVVALPIQGAELMRQEILRERLFLVASVNHPLCRGGSAALKDLTAEPFLLLKEGHCFRDTAIAACKRVKMSPNVVFESGHFSTILGMVTAGMGISIVPEMAVEPRNGCKFIPIEDERAIRRIGVVRLQSHFRSRPQREFMEHLAACASILTKRRLSGDAKDPIEMEPSNGTEG
jgi:LysR family transcriptional regulator, hydrogen peroxide-inducible genes activator